MTDAATIYWFSGTGNSLAVAGRVAASLEGARLLPIAAAPDSDPVRPEGVVGVVCPVYFEGLPLIVSEFLARLDARATTYSFLVLTVGGFAGWAPAQARVLFRRAGRRLDAAFSVKMPDNYVAVLDLPAPPAQARVLSQAGERVARIARDVEGRRRRLGVGIAVPLGALAYFVMGRRFARTCRRRDRRFWVTETCTACGVCARVCPKANVALSDGRPRWSGRCEQCFACVQWCPASAIQVRNRPTERRRRYHHPDVTAADIGSQRGRQGRT